MAGKPKRPERCSRCGYANSTLYQAGPPKRVVVDGHVRTVRVWLCEACAKEIGVKQNCFGETHKLPEGPDRCHVCAPDWNVIIKHPLALRHIGYCYTSPPFTIIPDIIFALTCCECGEHPVVGQQWHEVRPIADPLTIAIKYICGTCEKREREAEARMRTAQFY